MLDFLYHDEALAALAKPAGRIVVPGRGAAASERTLREDVAQALGCDVFVVHRLDRGTSGVLLFAITPAASKIEWTGAKSSYHHDGSFASFNVRYSSPSSIPNAPL